MAETVDLDYLLSEVVTLPSLPSTVARITGLVNDPDSTLADVGKAISADPAIALKALRLVNSAYYGLREQVTSVDHAVVLLGMKVVQNLVLTAAVFETLSTGEESLLRHNVACAVAMRIISDSGAAKNVAMEQPEDAFTFGLLHDVGKIIMQQHLPDEFKKVADAASKSDRPVAEIEREILGFDHGELGGRLAQHWKLPRELCSAISGHHNLAQCDSDDHKPLAATLAIADYLCYASGYPAREGADAGLDDSMWTYAGIANVDLIDIMDEFFESLDDIEELVQLAH